MKVLTSIPQIKKKNQAIGQHWFSKETMQFFGTRIESSVFVMPQGSLFITSEQDPAGKAWFGERRFTIRIAYPNGVIDTVRGFGEYFSLPEAKMAVMDIIRCADL